MKPLLKFLEANAEFVYNYGNVVLIFMFVLIFGVDYLLSRRPKTIGIKIARWAMVLLMCLNGALMYTVNIPFKPMIHTLASIDRVIGEEIADTEFINVRTGEVNRLSDINSEYVIINLWGTFCPPCIRELPDLMRVEEQYKEKLTVVALSNENPDKIVKFLQEREAPSIVGSTLDKNWMNPEEFLPVSIFIKDNVVVDKRFGQLTHEEIELICCSE